MILICRFIVMNNTLERGGGHLLNNQLIPLTKSSEVGANADGQRY